MPPKSTHGSTILTQRTENLRASFISQSKLTPDQITEIIYAQDQKYLLGAGCFLHLRGFIRVDYFNVTFKVLRKILQRLRDDQKCILNCLYSELNSYLDTQLVIVYTYGLKASTGQALLDQPLSCTSCEARESSGNALQYLYLRVLFLDNSQNRHLWIY